MIEIDQVIIGCFIALIFYHSALYVWCCISNRKKEVKRIHFNIVTALEKKDYKTFIKDIKFFLTNINEESYKKEFKRIYKNSTPIQIRIKWRQECKR